MSYATVADITGAGGEFSVPSGWSDAEVEDLITDAGEVIDNATKSHWELTESIIYPSGDGSVLLDLRSCLTWPLMEVSEVMYRADHDDDFDADGEEVTNYIISKSRRALQRIPTGATVNPARYTSNTWEAGVENYRVTGTFGSTRTPAGIKRACILLVREQLVPGSSLSADVPYSEQFPDGYQYNTVSGGANKPQPLPNLTGNRVVDAILYRYINNTPLLIGIGGA